MAIWVEALQDRVLGFPFYILSNFLLHFTGMILCFFVFLLLFGAVIITTKERNQAQIETLEDRLSYSQSHITKAEIENYRKCLSGAKSLSDRARILAELDTRIEESHLRG